MQDDIIRMALESGLGSVSDRLGFVMFNTAGANELQRFAALVAAHEREKFYGKDKPEECANGCPKNQVCDYCQRAEQAEQEPVAWLWVSEHGSERLEWEPVEDTSKWKSTPLYAAPVRTKDLTDDEILEITKRFALGIAFPVDGVTTPEMFACAVIAADREKNK